MITQIVIGFFIVLLLFIVFIILFGLFYRSKAGAVAINPQTGNQGQLCQQTMVPCETNADCAVCIDGIEMTCQQMNRYNGTQEKLYGKSGKYCLPEKPRVPCNEQHGGVQVWTGWASTDRMEFDCLCTYPDYWGDNGCQTLNAGICNGNDGSFVFDATTSTLPPGPSNCTCPSGMNKVVRQIGQSPLCIPGKVFPSYYSGTEQGGPIGGCQ